MKKQLYYFGIGLIGLGLLLKVHGDISSVVQSSSPVINNATNASRWKLDYSSYLGGDNSNEGQNGYAVIADSTNNMIVAGYTRSPGFPVTHRFGTAEIISGAFITKIDSTGQKILFSTFIPGGTVHSLALDSQDNIYITGDCTDYFTITNAFQTEYKGGSSEAFVAKLSSDGSKLLYSSFLGGSGMDMARGIAVDSQGQAWITGWTSSTNFPTTSNAIQPLFGGKYDAFVAKVSNTGKVLVYSSFLGGEKADASSAVALDNDGNVYLGGWTCSTNFLNQTVPLILGSGGWQNGMVVKLNSSGTAIQYLTLLGGTDRQSLVAAITVDNLGQAYLFGETDATNFPVSTQCWQDQNRGGFDNFIMKLNRQGSGIIYSTYLGGDDDDYASMYEYVGEDRIALGKAGIAIDSEGSAYVTARTSSRSFVPSGIAGNIFSGYYDGYAAKVNSDGSRLERFLYLGNSHWDAAFGLALDRMGRVLVTGSISPGPIPPFFPVTQGALVEKDGGNYSDAFITRLAETSGPPVNDSLGGRILLTGPRNTCFGNNTLASKEPGEPGHGGSAGKSLWWSWKAPANGRLILSTAGSSFDTVLAVYTNNAVMALQLVAINDNVTEADKTSEVKLAVQSGTEYLIAVDGHDSGNILLSLALSGPPNDDFANRITVTKYPITLFGSNVDATYEPGDPVEGRNVWWQWIAPISGSVAISTEGSNFESDLALFTNSTLSELGLVGVNDQNKRITLQAVTGTAYQISVGGGYNLSSGNIVLKISPGEPPSNDIFTNSIELKGAITNFTANSYAASRDQGEPELIGDDFHYTPGYHSVWWSWRAPEDGRVTISTEGSDFDTRLGIFVGSAINNLQLVAWNEDKFVPHGNSLSSQVNFGVISNTLYHIMVDGNVYSPEGRIQFALHFYHNFSFLNQTLVRPAASGFTLQGSGYPGAVYGVEISTNLMDWEAIPLESFTGPLFQWKDTNTFQYNRRFYRWFEKKP